MCRSIVSYIDIPGRWCIRQRIHRNIRRTGIHRPAGAAGYGTVIAVGGGNGAGIVGCAGLAGDDPAVGAVPLVGIGTGAAAAQGGEGAGGGVGADRGGAAADGGGERGIYIDGTIMVEVGGWVVDQDGITGVIVLFAVVPAVIPGKGGGAPGAIAGEIQGDKGCSI